MLSLEMLDNWILQHIGWWVPYGLAACIPILLGWFPGANARQHGHDFTWVVSAMSWLLTIATTGLVLHSEMDLLRLMPTFITLWTGIVAWSYGKRDLQPVVGVGRGFEIIFPKQFLETLELSAVE